MAKTHLSLSHDPALLNAPDRLHGDRARHPRLHRRRLARRRCCGDMQTMPGLGVKPAAFDVDIDESGKTVGLF